MGLHLLLFIGFLGSGKTTLVIRLAEHLLPKGLKVAILVNEIGEIGIDNQLMKQLDFNVWELLNGCICCTLSADLVTTLEKLDREYQPDLVIIEPSGAADPRSIHKALPYYHGTAFSGITTAAVVDPLRVEMLLEVMSPLVTAQITNANVLLITKTDLATPAELAQAQTACAELAPGTPVMLISPFTPIEDIAREVLPWLT